MLVIEDEDIDLLKDKLLTVRHVVGLQEGEDLLYTFQCELI
jgi:hypothetical protein